MKSLLFRADSKLWDSLNPKHPWGSNPFVWRIAFKVVKKEA